MAEKEGLETSHDITAATTGFQDRPLAFRVTSPCKSLAEAGCLANPREVSPATRDFRGHSLPFRVTLPLRNWIRRPVAQGYEPWMSWTRRLLGERLATSSGSFTHWLF